MKIVHVCLSCFYIDGYSYQENELVRQHVLDGHEVVVIASTESYGENHTLTYVKPRTYVGGEGAMVLRLPYRKWLPQIVMRKLRMHPGVYRLLEEQSPDIVLFHGLCGWELMTVARYKRSHEQVRVFVDSHEDSVNSARTLLSRQILHRLYYKSIIRKALPAFDRVLCVSLDTMQFVQEMYGIPRNKLEFYPLGGHIPDDREYAARRERGRVACGLTDDNIMLLQTGKMGSRKKLLEALRAFSSTPGERLRLILAGQIEEDIRAEAMARVNRDSRIQFVGWQSAEELRDLLCAADVYVQPGTQSATMQMSLCARCAVVLNDVLSHRPFVEGNGWLIGKRLSLEDAIGQVGGNLVNVEEMSRQSLAIAQRLLDYRSLAARLYV